MSAVLSVISPQSTTRQSIERLEGVLRNAPPIDCPVNHYFAPGLFAREISIPAGTVVVGAVHKADSLIVLSKGRLLIATEAGPVEISAPHTRPCKAGSKNAVTTLEDSVWTNFYPNPDDETDLAKLAERFTESKADELLGGCNNKQAIAAREAACLGA